MAAIENVNPRQLYSLCKGMSGEHARVRTKDGAWVDGTIVGGLFRRSGGQEPGLQLVRTGQGDVLIDWSDIWVIQFNYTNMKRS